MSLEAEHSISEEAIDKNLSNIVQEVEVEDLSEPETNPMDSIYDDIPDGGFGWVVIAGCFLLMGISWGQVNAYGQFQTYYLTLFPTTSQSILTLVGSLTSFCIEIFAIPASMMIGRFGPRVTVIVGSFIVCFSYMMTSLCTELWQLALAQGVLLGVGMAMMILVAYSLPQQWFMKKRGTATGIVSGGASIGGMIWPLLIQHLLTRVEFGWTCRILGFMYIPLGAIAAICLKERIPESQALSSNRELQQEEATFNDANSDSGKEKGDSSTEITTQVESDTKKKSLLRRYIFHSQFLLDWSVLKDIRFVLILTAVGVGYFAIFIPFFFLPSYAGLLDHVSPGVSNNILTITNGCSILGRIAPGLIGDKVGRLNTFIVATFFTGVVLFVFWLPGHNETLLLLTGISFSIFSGAFFGIAPAVIGQLFGLPKIKSRMTLFMFCSAPGALLGTVIGGAFLPTAEKSHVGSTEGYPRLITYAGIIFLCSTCFLIATKLLVSRKIFHRV